MRPLSQLRLRASRLHPRCHPKVLIILTCLPRLTPPIHTHSGPAPTGLLPIPRTLHNTVSHEPLAWRVPVLHAVATKTFAPVLEPRVRISPLRAEVDARLDCCCVLR